MANGTGASQADALIVTCETWNVKDKVVATCWDTTASNSGRRSGADILFQQALGRPCLSLACRHHVAERHIHHANKAVRGPDEGILCNC